MLFFANDLTVDFPKLILKRFRGQHLNQHSTIAHCLCDRTCRVRWPRGRPRNNVASPQLSVLNFATVWPLNSSVAEGALDASVRASPPRGTYFDLPRTPRAATLPAHMSCLRFDSVDPQQCPPLPPRPFRFDDGRRVAAMTASIPSNGIVAPRTSSITLPRQGDWNLQPAAPAGYKRTGEQADMPVSLGEQTNRRTGS